MMRSYFKTFGLCFLLLLTACSTVPEQRAPIVINAHQKAHLHDEGHVKHQLMQQYQTWKGVRYRIGGLSKRGVDCSGFVFLTYANKLGVQLPRSTALQSTVGNPVSRQHLRAGDLVFFKTGFKVRHVGIYLEKGRFLHASTSRGVMISRLDNEYWRDAYWHARRVAL